MEKLNRYRDLQRTSLEQFLEDVLSNPNCRYCQYHDDCQEMMGLSSIEEELGGYGCTAFDNSTDNLIKFFKADYKLVTTTAS